MLETQIRTRNKFIPALVHNVNFSWFDGWWQALCETKNQNTHLSYAS